MEEFTQVVGVILNNWTGLKLAIEHGMANGNPAVVANKVRSLVDRVMLAVLRNSEVAIEDTLDELMDSSFDTILEDGSTLQLSYVIYDLAGKWKSGNTAFVNGYISSLPSQVNILAAYKNFPPPSATKLPIFKKPMVPAIRQPAIVGKPMVPAIRQPAIVGKPMQPAIVKKPMQPVIVEQPMQPAIVVQPSIDIPIVDQPSMDVPPMVDQLMEQTPANDDDDDDDTNGGWQLVPKKKQKV